MNACTCVALTDVCVLFARAAVCVYPRARARLNLSVFSFKGKYNGVLYMNMLIIWGVEHNKVQCNSS